MSSKKEQTTIIMDGELLRLIRNQAAEEDRSLGFIVEKMAKMYFKVKVVEAGKEVTRNVD